jgi:hypothetical protein
MVTRVSESFFESLTPSRDLHSLENFALDISGANEAKVPYKGYGLLELFILSYESETIPVLVVPDTSYSSTVPVIVGTYVIRHFSTIDAQENIPSCWQQSISAVSLCSLYL